MVTLGIKEKINLPRHETVLTGLKTRRLQGYKITKYFIYKPIIWTDVWKTSLMTNVLMCLINVFLAT